MNENFIKLKDDLKTILTKVSKNPSYYYNNWISKVINEKKSTHKDVVEIFKHWTSLVFMNWSNSKPSYNLITEKYNQISDISILQLSVLLTDLSNNKDLAEFLCTIYYCTDHMEYLIELYSNEFQHQKFKEQYKNQISKETDYECGILVDDNLGLIKAVLDNPDMVKSVHLKDQVNTLVKKEWYPIYIADKIAGYKNTGWIRNYFELEKIKSSTPVKRSRGLIFFLINLITYKRGSFFFNPFKTTIFIFAKSVTPFLIPFGSNKITISIK